ncbi:MAG: hypothetical protein GX557_01975 [Chloroflexi bacterium]|nr:hypothetical protein [Chloroflexota bacterium]
MKANKQKTNWIIDAGLFLGFVLTFFLDLTGLALHQLLGVLVGALAAYHLLAHWAWVKAVTKRLFQCGCGKARWNYIIDAGVLLGMALILLTGLGMSTWLNLPLQRYYLWHLVHVWASIATVALVVLKLGLHWHWIVNVARKHILPKPQPAARPAPGGQPALVPVPVAVDQRRLDRRAFLVLMGGVSVAGALAIRNARASVVVAAPAGGDVPTEADGDAALREQAPVQPTAVPTQALAPAIATPATVTIEALPDTATTQPTAVLTAIPTAAPRPTAVAPDCVVRCPRGCSYPGSCRKYIDSNKNGKCDLGECL